MNEISELTKEEKAWVRKLQKVLNQCPSERLGAYTIGDNNIIIYDKSKEESINQLMDERGQMDFCVAVDELDAELIRIDTPFQVYSTAG